METRERKERLHKAQTLLNSEGWQFLKEEIEREKANQVEMLIACQRDGQTERSQFISGIIDGLNLVLKRPQYIANRSLGILEKLGDLMGVNR